MNTRLNMYAHEYSGFGSFILIVILAIYTYFTGVFGVAALVVFGLAWGILLAVHAAVNWALSFIPKETRLKIFYLGRRGY